MQNMVLKALVVSLLVFNLSVAQENTGTRSGKIILLNGITSAGKTSIVKAIQAKALQEESKNVWLAMGIDKMWTMMPQQYVLCNSKAADGFKLNFENVGGLPQAYFTYGSFGNKVARSFLQMLRRLVLDGHNLIVDEVLCDIGTLEPHLRAFEGVEVFFVGVKRDLAEAEEIEALRGDRPDGLARGQINRVHALAPKYDLEVNTSRESIFNVADKILEFVAQPHGQLVFDQMRQDFKKNNCLQEVPASSRAYGKVVIMNGMSSAGKTSIAKALQHEAEKSFGGQPWLSVGVDLMWDIVPRALIKNINNVDELFNGFARYVGYDASSNPVTTIKFGKVAQKIANSFIKMTRQLVEDGLNIIVDDVLCDGATIEPHKQTFSKFNPVWVGVYCDKKIALERELLRSDRTPGLVRGQIDRVHKFITTYDVVVDTSRDSMFDCARTILEHLQQIEKRS